MLIMVYSHFWGDSGQLLQPLPHLPQPHWMCHFGMRILSWRQLRSYRLKRNFCPSHNYIEGSQLGVFPRTMVITRDRFDLSEPSVQAGQISNYQTSALFIPLGNAFLSSKVPDPVHFIGQDDIYMSFCLSLEFPCLCGFSLHMLLNLIFSC